MIEFIMRRVAIIFIAIAAAVLVPRAARANGLVCAPHSVIAQHLGGSGRMEQRIGFGVSGNGLFLYEVWASRTGDFTFLVVNQQNVACILGGGVDWAEYDVPTTQGDRT